MLKTMQPIQPNTQVPLHTIQVGKSKQFKRPFFFLHGAWAGGGPPLFCVALSRAIGSSQPFYTFDSYDCNSPNKSLTLEELAAAHLQALRTVQPEGPYLLGGFCSGAFIAYEMTRQLQEQGQKVDLVVLIAPAKITDYHRRIRKAIALAGTLLHMSMLKQLHCFLYTRHMLRHVYRKVLPPTRVKIKDFPKLLAQEPRLNVLFPPVEALYKDFVGVFTWIGAGYTPRFSPEHGVFIWAGDDDAFRPKWQVAEKNNRAVFLPGPYMGLINENISLLAEQLKTFIDEAQTDSEMR
ncbi:MAG TPA: alpha/beta fold hydrolase [Ktedonobacteraceae bacterium]|jgi:hypothetical protein|nr:alpha/beta fold hydrolase [Ktedonobacteraceae bacterium]